MLIYMSDFHQGCLTTALLWRPPCRGVTHHWVFRKWGITHVCVFSEPLSSDLILSHPGSWKAGHFCLTSGPRYSVTSEKAIQPTDQAHRHVKEAFINNVGRAGKSSVRFTACRCSSDGKRTPREAVVACIREWHLQKQREGSWGQRREAERENDSMMERDWKVGKVKGEMGIKSRGREKAWVWRLI